MFNKETEYALRALVYIHLRNKLEIRPGLAEISREIESPPFFTAKILQRLVKNGIIQSLKGKGGGFYFEEDKDNLTIQELVFFTGGSKSLNGCGFGLKRCDSENPCPLHLKYAPIRQAMNELLSTETIRSLALKYNYSLVNGDSEYKN